MYYRGKWDQDLGPASSIRPFWADSMDSISGTVLFYYDGVWYIKENGLLMSQPVNGIDYLR